MDVFYKISVIKEYKISLLSTIFLNFVPRLLRKQTNHRTPEFSFGPHDLSFDGAESGEL